MLPREGVSCKLHPPQSLFARLVLAAASAGSTGPSSPITATQGPAQPRLQLPVQTFSARSRSLPAPNERDKLRVRSCWCCIPASPALAAGPECTCGTSRGHEDQNIGTRFLFNFWQKCNKKQEFLWLHRVFTAPREGQHKHTTAAHG